MAAKNNIVLLEWWNDCNIDGLVYEDENGDYNGFKQRAYFEVTWDTPIQTVFEDTKLNGIRDEILRYRSVAQRCVFVACGVKDDQLFSFDLIRSHKHIRLYNANTDEILELKAFNFTSTPSVNQCDNVGRFSFEVAKSIVTGCGCEPIDLDPCGDLESCIFANDFPPGGLLNISEVVFNGDQVFNGLQTLDGINTTLIGSFAYATDFVDFINGLGIECLTASYPTEQQIIDNCIGGVVQPGNTDYQIRDNEIMIITMPIGATLSISVPFFGAAGPVLIDQDGFKAGVTNVIIPSDIPKCGCE